MTNVESTQPIRVLRGLREMKAPLRAYTFPAELSVQARIHADTRLYGNRFTIDNFLDEVAASVAGKSLTGQAMYDTYMGVLHTYADGFGEEVVRIASHSWFRRVAELTIDDPMVMKDAVLLVEHQVKQDGRSAWRERKKEVQRIQTSRNRQKTNRRSA